MLTCCSSWCPMLGDTSCRRRAVLALSPVPYRPALSLCFQRLHCICRSDRIYISIKLLLLCHKNSWDKCDYKHFKDVFIIRHLLFCKLLLLCFVFNLRKCFALLHVLYFLWLCTLVWLGMDKYLTFNSLWNLNRELAVQKICKTPGM